MSESDTPTAFDTAAWKSAAPALDLLAVAYGLIDTAEQIVGEQEAMRRLGEETLGGKAVRPETRQDIVDAAVALSDIASQAAIDTKDKEAKAAADWWRAQFDLMGVNP